ncbi:triacylglycerol lipase, partial [Ancylostoma caninum]
LISCAKCGPVLATQPHFSDEFARTKVVPLCAATEGANPQTCLSRTFQNATALRKISVRCDKWAVDTCSGYVAVNHVDKAIMLAFRGTLGQLQLLVESEATVFEEKTPWVAGGSVSTYFYNAFASVWSGGIKDDFLATTHKYQDYELWIVGHSLGGAMASLAASYIVKMQLFDGNKIKPVTFGQPRTGDKKFADAHGNQIPYSFRVTHDHDVVPHVPPEGLEQYHHHKSEVYYNNDMTTADYVECDEEESRGCSDRNIDASFNDHHRYYNVYISRWGNAGCSGDPANPTENFKN